MMRDERETMRREIRSIMVKKGIIAAQIARELGVTRGHVALVISGGRYSRRVVDALEKAGIPRELFRHEEELVALDGESCGEELGHCSARSCA